MLHFVMKIALVILATMMKMANSKEISFCVIRLSSQEFPLLFHGLDSIQFYSKVDRTME